MEVSNKGLVEPSLEVGATVAGTLSPLNPSDRHISHRRICSRPKATSSYYTKVEAVVSISSLTHQVLPEAGVTHRSHQISSHGLQPGQHPVTNHRTFGDLVASSRIAP